MVWFPGHPEIFLPENDGSTRLSGYKPLIYLEKQYASNFNQYS